MKTFRYELDRATGQKTCKYYTKKTHLKKSVKYTLFGITNLIILLNIPLLVGRVNSYEDYVRIMIEIILFILIDTIVLYRIEK